MNENQNKSFLKQLDSEKQFLQYFFGSSNAGGRVSSQSRKRDFSDPQHTLKHYRNFFRDQTSILHAMLDNTTSVIYVKDMEGRYLFVNRAYEKLFNIKHEDMNGKSDHDIFPKEFADRFRANDKKISETGKAIQFEEVAPHDDGPHTYISVKFPLCEEEGKVYAVCGISTDITERKRAEESVERNQARFKSLVSNIPGAVYRCSNDKDWTMDFLSPAIEELTGYPPEEFIQTKVRSYASIIHPEDASMVDQTVQKAVREKQAYTLEYRILHRGGSIRWVYEKGRAAYGEGGEVLCLEGVIFDITEKKRAEETVSRTTNYLENIINTVADPIFVKDREHRWILLNDVCCRFMGYTRGQLIGKSDYEFFPKEQADIFWKKDEEVFNTGKENLNEEYFTDSKKVLHTIVTKKTLYVDPQGEKYIVGVIRDVTEQKQAERSLVQKTAQLSQANAEREYLELFAYVASHDLQEPLQKMIAFGGLLKTHSAQDLDEKGRGFVEKMQMAAMRMSRMIEGLLQFTKVTAAGHHDEPVDLEMVVGEVLSDLDMKISQIKAKVEVGDLPVLRADRSQMHQLFLNLMTNALKFHKKGTSPVIHIQSRTLDKGFVEITITDNGVGFDEKYVSRMFRPFERLHSRDEFEGSGIGLAICKKIVTHHGGKITAKSHLDKGSVFIVTLPKGLES